MFHVRKNLFKTKFLFDSEGFAMNNNTKLPTGELKQSTHFHLNRK